MYVPLLVKNPLFLSDFNDTWIFSTDIRKILECQISLRSIQWEPSCSVRTDGQTDMRKLIVAFRNFSKEPKTWQRFPALQHSAQCPTACNFKHLQLVNLLKPSGFCTYRKVEYSNSTWCSLCVESFVRISEQTATFALYSINWLVSIAVVESVYCAVRTDSLYTADYVSSLKG